MVNRKVLAIVGLVVGGALLNGCYTLPTPNSDFDYQLGGAYPPPSGVGVVTRDRTASPVAGLYNICYVNGFQAQPDEESWWLANHPDLVLRDAQGHPVYDTMWNELVLDISTPAKRTALADIIEPWLKGCAASGFKGVDLDNLDSYSRSGGRLTADQAIAFAKLLTDRGHAANLAMGQKNAAELVSRKADTGFDFVVAEECNRYGECGAYTAGYGDNVFVIEYRQVDFDTGCRDWPNLSIVLRDVNLVPAGSAGYVRAAC